ncbi:MAG TPA: hypothetical protein VMG58_12755, partial [Candidatus Sulfotelmatobacter sp.]|nr:hypothetical protein [Candidatus Sulfotelmatobacter sp.]
MKRSVSILVFAGLTLVAARQAAAVGGAPDQEYLAIFQRGGLGEPFAVVVKPKGVPIGPGTDIQIEA